MSFPNGDLGPCKVLFDSVDLGDTLGGVKFSDEVKYAELHTDGNGESVVDAVTTGRVCQVTVPLTRSSLTVLKKVIAAATQTTGVNNLIASSSVGAAMYASAKEMILKPLENNVASTDDDTWLYLFKAYPVGKIDFTYDVKSQRVMEITFLVFPDQTSGYVGRMWRLGPES